MVGGTGSAAAETPDGTLWKVPAKVLDAPSDPIRVMTTVWSASGRPLTKKPSPIPIWPGVELGARPTMKWRSKLEPQEEMSEAVVQAEPERRWFSFSPIRGGRTLTGGAGLLVCCPCRLRGAGCAPTQDFDALPSTKRRLNAQQDGCQRLWPVLSVAPKR